MTAMLTFEEKLKILFEDSLLRLKSRSVLIIKVVYHNGICDIPLTLFLHFWYVVIVYNITTTCRTTYRDMFRQHYGSSVCLSGSKDNNQNDSTSLYMLQIQSSLARETKQCSCLGVYSLSVGMSK